MFLIDNHAYNASLMVCRLTASIICVSVSVSECPRAAFTSFHIPHIHISHTFIILIP